MPPVRRLVALLLLVFLPLQFGWAAAAPYCQHEADSQVQHFGHHGHQHHDAADESSTDGKLSGDVDSDCSACHAGAAAVLVGLVFLTGPSGAHDPVDAYRFSLASSPATLPERPNWSALA
jgi:hypothetical protein